MTGKVVPARRVSLSVEASHPGQFSLRDKPEYHVNGNVVLGNMLRRFLPRDNSLSRDNMLSRVHVNRVLDRTFEECLVIDIIVNCSYVAT